MTADDMVEKYGVTTEKAAAIAAAQRYMTSEAWARLVKKLEECAGDAEAIREAIDKGGGQSCDVEGVLRELEKAGFAILRTSDFGKGTQ